MATKLTKKQQGELTEKLTGIIQKNNALQLRLSADRSVNEMNVNQISGALNRIHGQAIGKELPTVVTIPVNQSGSGDPSPDNVRPISGYEIDGIGTVYGGELNIETGVLTVTYSGVDLSALEWEYLSNSFFLARSGINSAQTNLSAANTKFVCSRYSAKQATWNRIATSYIDQCVGIYTTQVRIADTSYADVNSFRGSLYGAMLCYELATPETYTLTPEQMIQLLDQL